jgi:hypothetical protein
LHAWDYEKVLSIIGFFDKLDMKLIEFIVFVVFIELFVLILFLV